jgi:hypothetical protein
MNPINLLITFSDGSTHEVTAVISDLMAFETKFDKSVSDFQKGVRLSWLVFIAHAAETRTGATKMDFEAYAETISSIDVPTQKK